MAKKSLTQAMRPLASMCTSSVSRSTRQFSTSPAHGLRAIFTETDNADLNNALGKIQEKIILPAHLPEKQRQHVFSPKKRNFIQQNPIIIELDGLEHRFSTIDPFFEVPNSKKILLSVLELMKTKEEWENLGTLLAGYQKAGIKLRPHHYMRMIRKAGREGQIYSIIECTKQAPKTGFKLTQQAYIIQLLTFISEKEPAIAQKWTEIVLDLLERPPHVQNAGPSRQLNVLVRGQALYAQASKAQVQEELGDRELESLEDAATLYVSRWTQQAEDSGIAKAVAELDPATPQDQSQGVRVATVSANEFIQAIALNIKGLSVTRELLKGKEVTKSLDTIEKNLEEYLRGFVEKSGSKYRDFWAETYEKVMGKKPQWPVPSA